MTRPRHIQVIDTMIGMPDDLGELYGTLDPVLAGDSSKGPTPISYLFPNSPRIERGEDFLKLTLTEMDRFGIERGLIPISYERGELAQRALTEHPTRFVAEYLADPNRGMDEVRTIVRLKEQFDLKAVTAFPCGGQPSAPISDRRWFPIYTKCIELGIPFVPMMGIPGPRVPFAPQDVAQLDELCYLLPELTIVTRHGCEPWTELMVKLMLKWPNLYFSTTAFAPKYYSDDIIDYMNTRGAQKVIYGGYWPFGLSFERSFDELDQLPLRDEVWQPFLRDNAIRVFKL